MRWRLPAILILLACPCGLWAEDTERPDTTTHFANEEDDFGSGWLRVPHFGSSRIPVLVFRSSDGNLQGWMDAYRQYYEAPRDQPGFRRFYYVNSNGRFDPEPTVLQPLVVIECPLGVAGNPADSENPCEIASRDLILFDLIALYEQHHGPVDWGQFDTNGPEGKPDGFLDGLIIQSTLQFQYMQTFGGLSFYFEPHALSDGTLVVSAAGVFNFDDGVTPAHEFGHLLGLDDSANLGDVGSLMAYGQGTLGAVDRVNLGWSELRIIEDEGDYLFPPSLESGVVYRAGKWPEYWLIENRRPLVGIENEEGHSGPSFLRLGLHITQVNLRPDADEEQRYDLDSHGMGIASGLLPGQELMSVPANDIVLPEDLHGNTNYATGEPSGLTITGIEYSGDYSPCGLPYMKAHIVPPQPPSDAPSLEVECRSTGDCSGTRVCRNAQCVEAPEALPRLTLETFEPYCVEKSQVPEESGGNDTGCSCRAVDAPPDAGMALWLGVLALFALRWRATVHPA